MNVTCNDRDSIFEDGTPAQWAALETHAATCPACAEQLRAWKSLSLAAAQLRDYDASPSLWPRIESALAAGAQASNNPVSWWDRSSAWLGFRLSWQLAAAGAFALLLLVSGGWRYRNQTNHRSTTASQSPLLTVCGLPSPRSLPSVMKKGIFAGKPLSFHACTTWFTHTGSISSESQSPQRCVPMQG